MCGSRAPRPSASSSRPRLGGHRERIALVPTRASGQRGFACYADEHGAGEHTAYGVMIFALHGDKIAGITGFPQDMELFEQFAAARPHSKSWRQIHVTVN